MKALLSRAPGGPETLELGDLPMPVAGPGEVVIAVKACAINFPDNLIIVDQYQFKPPRPFAPGSEVSGTIAAVGAGVTRFGPGDRVVALTLYGGLAEYVAVPEAKVFPMPADVDFDTGSALIFTYGTGIHALHDRAGLKPGETLLVLGAAGGVGLAAVELGKAMGARVVAAVSSAEKAEAARAAGADVTVTYPRGPFDKPAERALADQFKAACGSGGADVVYDAVGGDYSEAAMRAIGWEGRLLVVGFPAGIARIPLNLPLLKSCDIRGVFWGGFAEREPDRLAAQVAELFELLGAGKIRPRISEILPLAEGGSAIARLAERAAVGKFVIRIAD